MNIFNLFILLPNNANFHDLLILEDGDLKWFYLSPIADPTAYNIPKNIIMNGNPIIKNK